jgi:hypothetical protein
MSDRAPSVFISHAGPDSDHALQLHRALCAVGVEARLDQIELHLGDNFIRWMNEAASESDYLLVLVSPNSLGRYWVETEWSAALAREADLRRTFVIPVVLPGVEDKAIPFLLRAKIYLDLRKDEEASLLTLINMLKHDQQIARDRGRCPSPAPLTAQEEVYDDFRDCSEWLRVIVYSNRFSRTFKFMFPAEATPSYILGLLRSKLNLKWSNIDTDLMVELSYTYAIGFRGKNLPLDTPIRESGVTNDSMLELWIRVTLTDLLEKQGKGQKVGLALDGPGKTSLMRACYFVAVRTINSDVLLDKIGADSSKKDEAIKRETDRIMKLLMLNRDFTPAQIAMIAERYFAHVDA